MALKALFYLISLILILLTEKAKGQCPSSIQINSTVNELDGNSALQAADKLKQFLFLKAQFEKCNHPKDSVYAKILHKIAFFEYGSNQIHLSKNCIKNTLESIRINTSGQQGSDPSFATKSYYNMAWYYKAAGLPREALKYYDTAIQFAVRFPVYSRFLLNGRNERCNIFFQLGDYQRSVEEASLALNDARQRNDLYFMVSFANQRAQAHQFQNLFQRSDADAALAIHFATQLENSYIARKKTDSLGFVYYELANSYKIRAESGDTSSIKETRKFIDKAIFYREKSGFLDALARDYILFGVIYFTRYKDYDKAKANFQKSIQYCDGSKANLAFAHLNLGAVNFVQGNFKETEKNYLNCLDDLGLNSNSILHNPALAQINLISEQEFVTIYLNNKTEYLLCRYRQTGDTAFLKACIRTSLLTDSLIKSMRHEQVGEQSKLFWRNSTREFYTNALHACFISNDPRLAFYFMESSRAVILSDKLNELGASSSLPFDEAVKEQRLKTDLINKQQTLSFTKMGTKEYESAELELLESKQAFERFIRTLEKKYPSYYQYKHADDIPSLEQLKKYLSANEQSFVHYFMGDTVTFVLAISANNVKMLHVDKARFELNDIEEMLRFFSNKQLLNNHYSAFASLSYKLNKSLFDPLNLPKGRVVVCPDNFVLPFEALSTDALGRKMLINDYAFSYIYSAGYLLKRFPEYSSKGNFIGFAPVSFRSDLGLADLKKSAISLSDVAGNYSKILMYKTNKATRRNFLSNMGSYSIVNVFSHAYAGDGDDEPMLYMQDSVIRLADLQLLNHPCTKLVVLSACQTAAGKNATGEGIYSLARGFAAAGIPSVAATVWKADEETVYSISKLFHQYLSQGIRKDEALQRAKLQFISSAAREKALPYYWANMVIIGKAEPILLHKEVAYRIWMIAGTSLLLLCGGIIFYRKVRIKKHHII